VTLAPIRTARGTAAMAATVDGIATEAALAMLRRGGSAADAAIAANAVLTVTLPSQCGLGGDLFALVQPGPQAPVESLVSAGRAGSGASAAALRDAGFATVPAEDDIRAVTIPGCADGWIALHERHGRLPLADVLAPAIHYAVDGFPVSRYMAGKLVRRAAHSPAARAMLVDGALREGQRTRRPETGRVLGELAAGGRRGFWEGTFGAALLAAGDGLFSSDDVARSQAEWAPPVSIDAFGHRLWTPGAPSQGYLALAAAAIAESIGVPEDPDDPRWPHLLVEAMRQAAHDRPERLHDGADVGAALAPDRIAALASRIDLERTTDTGDAYRPGGTTYLAVVDADGMAVSLIQSNCMSFGSGIELEGTGIWLQDRGIGFSLVPGHPNELAPGARPAHTLAPMLVTAGGAFAAALGTRGGDTQPQILLQLLARTLVARQDPAEAVAAGRWLLRGLEDETSFNTWGFEGRVRVEIEGQAPESWLAGLRDRGHRVERVAAFGHPFGHAQLVRRRGDGVLEGAADPRSTAESAAGY